jgi:hypothetical protein
MPESKEEKLQAQTPQPEQKGAETADTQKKRGACKDPWKEGFRFDDPYWDEAFDSYHSPTLRVCCLHYC